MVPSMAMAWPGPCPGLLDSEVRHAVSAHLVGPGGENQEQAGLGVCRKSGSSHSSPPRDPAGQCSHQWLSVTPTEQRLVRIDTHGQPGADKTGPPSPGPLLRGPARTPSLVPDAHGGLATGQTRSCPRAAGLSLASTLSSGKREHRAPGDGQRILGKSITPGDQEQAKSVLSSVRF